MKLRSCTAKGLGEGGIIGVEASTWSVQARPGWWHLCQEGGGWGWGHGLKSGANRQSAVEAGRATFCFFLWEVVTKTRIICETLHLCFRHFM